MFARLRHAFAPLLAVLLLSAIGVHAAVPARALEQVRGSAFSAATTDVAVLANHRPAERAAVQLDPVWPPTDDGLLPVIPANPLSAAVVSPLPQLFTPLHPVRARPAQPRAPPAY